jgi:hypothetical protein
MFPIIVEDIKLCSCGGAKIKNDFGISYCDKNKTFFCPCGAPLKPPNNGEAKCTRCTNGVAMASLFFGTIIILKIRES